MTLTVESKDGKVEAFYCSELSKDSVFISINIDKDWLQPPITIKHSDIDSVIEVLQLYKARMTEVLGSDSLK
jgi:hypothetical protein